MQRRVLVRGEVALRFRLPPSHVVPPVRSFSVLRQQVARVSPFSLLFLLTAVGGAGDLVCHLAHILFSSLFFC